VEVCGKKKKSVMLKPEPITTLRNPSLAQYDRVLTAPEGVKDN
jgi:hypothetical protein